jgi:hypothetical protein
MTPPHLPSSPEHPSSAQHPLVEGIQIFTLRESCCAGCEIEYLYGREVVSLDALSFAEHAPDEIELRRAALPEARQPHLGESAWYLKFIGSNAPRWTSTYVPLPLTIEGEYHAIGD